MYKIIIIIVISNSIFHNIQEFLFILKARKGGKRSFSKPSTYLIPFSSYKHHHLYFRDTVQKREGKNLILKNSNPSVSPIHGTTQSRGSPLK